MCSRNCNYFHFLVEKSISEIWQSSGFELPISGNVRFQVRRKPMHDWNIPGGNKSYVLQCFAVSHYVRLSKTVRNCAFLDKKFETVHDHLSPCEIVRTGVFEWSYFLFSKNKSVRWAWLSASACNCVFPIRKL